MKCSKRHKISILTLTNLTKETRFSKVVRLSVISQLLPRKYPVFRNSFHRFWCSKWTPLFWLLKRTLISNRFHHKKWSKLRCVTLPFLPRKYPVFRNSFHRFWCPKWTPLFWLLKRTLISNRFHHKKWSKLRCVTLPCVTLCKCSPFSGPFPQYIPSQNDPCHALSRLPDYLCVSFTKSCKKKSVPDTGDQPPELRSGNRTVRAPRPTCQTRALLGQYVVLVYMYIYIFIYIYIYIIYIYIYILPGFFRR